MAKRLIREVAEPLKAVVGDLAKDPWVVLHKPAGLPVQALLPNDSVENRLAADYGRQQVIFPHRLDKHTQGLMVVAFDPELSSVFSRSITNREWSKRYRALAELPSCVTHTLNGLPSAWHHHGPEELACRHLQGGILSSSGALMDSGMLRSWLVRRPLRSPPVPATLGEMDRYFAASRLPCGCMRPRNWHLDDDGQPRSPEAASVPPYVHPLIPDSMLYSSVHRRYRPNRQQPQLGPPQRNPQEAITTFKLLSLARNRQYALFDVNLVTGRTHQIRIHFADAGFPLKDDPYYNQNRIWHWLKHEQKALEEGTADMTRWQPKTPRTKEARARTVAGLQELSASAASALESDTADRPPEAVAELPSASDRTLRLQHPLGLQAAALEFPSPTERGKWIKASLPVPEEWKAVLNT